MKSWIGWLKGSLSGWLGGAVLGLLMASAGWAALFYNQQIEDVTTFDAFTMLVTFVSLAANVIQWREAQAAMVPVRNPLIGLFNELKSRQGRVWGKQARIKDSSTPLEFYDFTEEVLQAYEQLREHVISLIETAAPGLPDDAFFRASTRGLERHEKEMRAEWVERRRRKDNRDAAVAPEPARTMFRRYEGKREAVILRAFAGGFQWTLSDSENKVEIEGDVVPTLEQAQADADAAAGTTPQGDWRSRA